MKQDFSIVDYGAVGDGQTMNTAALQAAIDACVKARGGTVTIPGGTYLSGSFELKSNVTLSLDAGAILKGSSDMADYSPVPFHHNEFPVTQSLIWAIGASNVRICGDGLIDLSGSGFQDWSRVHPSTKMRKDVALTDEQEFDRVVVPLERPSQPIFFHDCDRLRLDGIHVTDGACWTITMSTCRNVKVQNVTIESHLKIANGDGIHLCSCKDVIITDSKLSCGDDCVAITAITNWDEPCERIIISNCVMRSRSSCVRIGYLRSKVRSVVVSNLIIQDSNRGVGISVGDGGRVVDVRLSNIISETRLIPGGWWGHGEPLMVACDTGGTIQGISLSGVRALADSGILVYAAQSGSVRDVTIQDTTISLRQGRDRAIFEPVYDVLPATPIPAPDPAVHLPYLTAVRIDGLTLSNVQAKYADGEQAAYRLDPVIQNCTEFRELGTAVQASPLVPHPS